MESSYQYETFHILDISNYSFQLHLSSTSISSTAVKHFRRNLYELSQN